MQPSLDREIRDHLLDYLKSAATLDQFKDWLISATWDSGDDSESTAMQLTYEIQLALADQSTGITTESELRDVLSDLVHAVR